MKMIDRQGAVSEIPDDQAQAAYQSGKYGFLKGATLPIVTSTGKVGTIQATAVDDAFDKDARIATEEEYKHAQNEAKYGHGLPMVQANAEAFARGITGGISDPFAIGVAKTLHGAESGDALRERLAGRKEANPLSTGASEMAGMALPFLVPGGGELEAASMAARGAEAAEGAGALLEGGTALAKAGTAAGEAAGAAGTAAKAGTAAGEAAGAAGEAAGAAAEGASVAPEVAGVAQRAASPLAQAVRGAGVVPRAVAGAGDLTEKAIARIVGREAGGFVGRTAQKVAARAGAGAVEGALYGLGTEIDESALGDTDLNAEKLLAAAGYGALLGGSLSTIVTGGGELAREVAGRASPMLRKLAGIQAYKAASPGKAFSETALRRLGGAEAVGNTVIDHGILDNAATVEDIRNNTIKAIDKAGAALGESYRGSPATVTAQEIDDIFKKKIAEYEKLALHGEETRALKQAHSDFMAAIAPDIAAKVSERHIPGGLLSEEEIQGLLNTHGVGVLRDTAALKKLGIERIENFGVATRPREIPGSPLAQDEIQKLQAEHGADFIMNDAKLAELGLARDPKTLQVSRLKRMEPARALTREEELALVKDHGRGILDDAKKLRVLGYELKATPSYRRMDKVVQELTPESVIAAAREAQVPIQTLIEQRRALGAKAYREQLQNDPHGRVKALREIYGEISDAEDMAFERAEKNFGGVKAAELKAARVDFARLKHYEQALNRSNARFVTNRNLSMSDYMVGLASVAAGHPMVGVGKALAHKWFRERGNAFVARYASKLASFGAIDRAASLVDREIDRGVSSFFRPGERSKPRVRDRHFTGPKGEGETGDFKAGVKAVAHATAHADAHADHLGRVSQSIEQHAPQTAKALQRIGLAITSHLADSIPKGTAPPPNTLSPHLHEPAVSDVDKAKYNRTLDMGHDPVGTTFGRMDRGMLTPTDVENLQTMYPKLYDQIRTRAMEELSRQGSKLDFDKRMQLGLLLNIPADPAIEPLFVQTMQSTYAKEAEEGQPQQQRRQVPQREIKTFEEKAKLQGN